VEEDLHSALEQSDGVFGGYGTLGPIVVRHAPDSPSSEHDAPIDAFKRFVRIVLEAPDGGRVPWRLATGGEPAMMEG
jgi:hypothetical protein